MCDVRAGRALRTQAAHRIDGILLLDKPVGITSNAALVQSRRLLGAAKAGHTGTLDPLASGLLPICLGEATKFARVAPGRRQDLRGCGRARGSDHHRGRRG